MAEYYLYGWTPHTCVPLLLHSRQVVPDKHAQNAQCKEKGLPVRSRSGEILDQNGIAYFLSVFLCPCKWLSFWPGEGTVTILVQELVSCSCLHQGPGKKGKGQGIVQRKLCILWHGCSWELASLLTSCFRFLHPSALPFHGSHVIYFCPNVQTLSYWCKDDLDQDGLLYKTTNLGIKVLAIGPSSPAPCL